MVQLQERILAFLLLLHSPLLPLPPFFRPSLPLSPIHHQQDSSSIYVNAPPTPTDNQLSFVAGLLSGMNWDSNPVVRGSAPTGMINAH